MATKSACMICGKEREGVEVREDHVIKAMRWFKVNVTKNAKGYRIVVCKECMEKYKKLRAKFVRRRALYLALGVVFTVSLGIISSGRPLAILTGIVITVALYGLSLVSYMPALKSGKSSQKTASR